MKALAMALVIILVMLPTFSTAQEKTGTLVVQVVTPDGRPKQGLTVVAEGSNFRETAVTNASGFAVFRQLSPGSYDVVVSLQNIELVRRGITFPETQSLVLEAPLAQLSVIVSDLAGRIVGNIPVTLNSPTGVISTTRRTNATGYVVFSDIPYSSVARVGGAYTVTVLKEGVVVGRAEVEVKSPYMLEGLRASLVDVNFTVTNKEGHPVALDATLSLSAYNYSQTVSLSGGVASAKQLISTSVVGPYNASVTVRLGQRSVTVYSSFLSLEADAHIYIAAEVGELQVKVVDPDGKPVKGVGILVGAAGYGNFTSGFSDDHGTFSAGLLPLSSKVGDYVVSIFRGRARIQAEPISLDSARKVGEIILRFQQLSLRVTDYAGNPLNNAEIMVIDPQTGRQSNTTTANGVASLNVFPGTNELLITYKQKQVYRRSIDIAGGELSIRLNSVNFPVTVRVLDGIGRFVEGLRLTVKVDGVEVVDRLTGVEPVSVMLELPGEVVVEVHDGGRLLAKERLFAEGPSSMEIRFTDFVAVGGSLIPLQTIASTALAAVLAGALGVLAYRLLVKRQR
ncbi:MAG: carboxypeptidase regulatory-like domain-containing protein [Candidatus Caldarchaeum sp.]